LFGRIVALDEAEPWTAPAPTSPEAELSGTAPGFDESREQELCQARGVNLTAAGKGGCVAAINVCSTATRRKAATSAIYASHDMEARRWIAFSEEFPSQLLRSRFLFLNRRWCCVHGSDKTSLMHLARSLVEQVFPAQGLRH